MNSNNNTQRKAGLSGLRLSTVAAFVVATVTIQPVATAAEEKSENIETIIVSATRTEKAISDVPGTVSLIDDAQIQREIANDISDLVRYEPGVSVSGGGRFGLSGFSIRGISGDRVLTLVDNTPTADEFSFGPFLSSRRDFVDLDALKAVEIVRGPSSSAFGSNAIGGVVNFVTKDPLDYLEGESFAGSAKFGYSSIDSSTNVTALAAFGNETFSGMVVGTLRDFSETETFFDDVDVTGSGRRSQNPQDAENQNLFAKLVYVPAEGHSIAFVAEQFDSEADTDVLTAAGTFSRGVLTNSQRGIDDRTRERFSLDYRMNAQAVIFDDLSVLAYTQSSDAQQTTLTERLSPQSGIQDRVRDSFYEQENSGVRIQFNKTALLGSSTHTFTYGFDYDVSDSITLREGSTVNRIDGSIAPEFSNFPTRDFPNSEYTTQAFFLQDDIQLLDGRLSIIPAVRYDSFELDPVADAIYLSGNTGSPTPEGYDESEVSAKIGVIFDLTESWSVFSQYAEGFRAPPLDAVNSGFTNFAGGYTTLPNPDLRPERGESFELGFRHTSEYLSLNLVGYRNDYEDFIESLAFRGFNFRTGLLEFQARNLPEASIEGFEFKALADLSGLTPALEGVQARVAYAYSDGENEETNQPLNSIDPQQLVVGLGYSSPNDRWGIESVLTLTDRKDASDIDSTGLQTPGAPAVQPFETPGFGLLDLIGYYNVTDSLRLNWGVFNVADKQIYQWSEEFVQNPATTNFDRLTEPGRNYSVTVKYSF